MITRSTTLKIISTPLISQMAPSARTAPFTSVVVLVACTTTLVVNATVPVCFCKTGWYTLHSQPPVATPTVRMATTIGDGLSAIAHPTSPKLGCIVLVGTEEERACGSPVTDWWVDQTAASTLRLETRQPRPLSETALCA